MIIIKNIDVYSPDYIGKERYIYKWWENKFNKR